MATISHNVILNRPSHTTAPELGHHAMHHSHSVTIGRVTPLRNLFSGHIDPSTHPTPHTQNPNAYHHKKTYSFTESDFPPPTESTFSSLHNPLHHHTPILPLPHPP